MLSYEQNTFKADSHSVQQSVFTACVNAKMEKFQSLCGNTTVCCRRPQKTQQCEWLIHITFRLASLIELNACLTWTCFKAMRGLRSIGLAQRTVTAGAHYSDMFFKTNSTSVRGLWLQADLRLPVHRQRLKQVHHLGRLNQRPRKTSASG